MMEEDFDNNPTERKIRITLHPLYNFMLFIYWAFVGVTVIRITLALIGWASFPATVTYYAAFAPAVVILFYTLLEEIVEDAVYTGTRRAMAEIIEHLEDMMPEVENELTVTEEDEERIITLFNSDPAGRA